MKKLLFLCLIVSFVLPQQVFAQPTSSIDKEKVIKDMIEAMDNVRTMRFKLKKQERISGKLKYGEQTVKLNVSPFKVYIKVKEPDEDAEVLYVEGERGGQTLVNPAKFPYINLNLDPYGDILRKDQHHTIFELGFRYMSGIVKDAYKRFGDKVDEYVIYEGDVTWNGRQCYKATIDNKDFAYINYTVKSGEDILDIAKKHFVSEIMIVEANSNVDDFDDVKAGQTIKIPNTYCRKITFYIDKEWMLPIYQKLWDDKGVFAEYQYLNVTLNGKMDPAEFTSDFKGYGF